MVVGVLHAVLRAFSSRLIAAGHLAIKIARIHNLLYFGAERDNPFHLNFSLIFLQGNYVSTLLPLPLALSSTFIISRDVFLFMIRYLSLVT